MKHRGIELSRAHSPPAKGRVERRHGRLQDRLVEELRLAGIREGAGANAFLRKSLLPQINRRFTVAAANAAAGPRAGPRDLDAGLRWEAEPVVQRDRTVAGGGRGYQIEKGAGRLNRAGRRGGADAAQRAGGVGA
jgi:hypothetical protein